MASRADTGEVDRVAGHPPISGTINDKNCLNPLFKASVFKNYI